MIPQSWEQPGRASFVFFLRRADGNFQVSLFFMIFPSHSGVSLSRMHLAA